MPDTKLTDLEIVTQPKDGDILYIVDIDQDASKQITYNNLIGTKIDSLSTSFDNLSSNLVIDIDANTTNITTAQNDIIDNSTYINTLSSDAITLSANIDSISSFIFPNELQISGVDMNKFSFGTSMAINSSAPATQHITTFNTEIGDIGMVTLSALGGLSGLETNFYPMSANKFELIISARANDDRTITIPANTVFTYFVTRSVIQ
jgi:hypothetical protein